MSLIYILLTLLIFSVLVLVHEAGHFAVAKINGIMVEEFAIGMGPVVFSKQVGETLYSFRALPIGGFCRMLGEDEDESDSRAFNNKGVLARIAVVATGPIMNFVFGFIAVFIVMSTSAAVIEPVVGSILENSNAINQGLMEGDRIKKINNQSVHTYQDLSLTMAGEDGSDINVVVERNGNEQSLTITPIPNDSGTGFIIGFSPVIKTGLLAEEVEGYNQSTLSETVYNSFYTLVYYVKSVVVGFVRLFTLNLSPAEVAGPIGIVQVVGDTVEVGITYSIWSVVRSLLTLSALLSVNLGVINLFPIPAMDGGRLVFLIIEGLRGKPMDRNREGFIHFLGFVLLMMFMFVVASNDIFRIISGR